MLINCSCIETPKSVIKLLNIVYIFMDMICVAVNQ